MLALFDNEEIGSLTRQGADSTFLGDVLERVALSCGKDREGLYRAIAGGFMLSADNAHAVHPDSPEKSDPTNRCYLNEGVVVKHSPRYASDALTAGVFQAICQKAGVPVQVYYNNSRIPGGGTLGNLSGSHVALPTVDIGLPQLSMHSPMRRPAPRIWSTWSRPWRPSIRRCSPSPARTHTKFLKLFWEGFAKPSLFYGRGCPGKSALTAGKPAVLVTKCGNKPLVLSENLAIRRKKFRERGSLFAGNALYW